jgi:hypothetical protein
MWDRQTAEVFASAFLFPLKGGERRGHFIFATM